jgi:hypothetical protein
MGWTNGSRECAPDDELRDTRHVIANISVARKGVSQVLNLSCERAEIGHSQIQNGSLKSQRRPNGI